MGNREGKKLFGTAILLMFVVATFGFSVIHADHDAGCTVSLGSETICLMDIGAYLSAFRSFSNSEGVRVSDIPLGVTQIFTIPNAERPTAHPEFFWIKNFSGEVARGDPMFLALVRGIANPRTYA